TRTEGLGLKQIVADAAHVEAKLDGVIAFGFRPDVSKENIGLGANPGQAGRETKEGRVAEIGEIDAKGSAGKVVDVDTGNAEGIGCLLSIAHLLRIIAIAVDPEARLRDQARRENMIVIDGAAMSALNASALESCAAGSTGPPIDPINRRVESDRPRV